MKFLNTRILGIIGIIGAPWMFIDYINNGLYEHFMPTSESGFRNFVFTIGWLCSALGLYKLRAMGNKRWQKAIMLLELICLSLVVTWCFIEMVAPKTPFIVSFEFDFLWPFSAFFMTIAGVVILRAKKLKGWKRFMPLLVGFWLPLTLCIYYFTQNSLLSFVISGIYSTVAFSLLGFGVATENKALSFKKSFTV